METTAYPPLIEIREVKGGSRLGRPTLDATVMARRELERRRGRGLHGLVIGDADEIRLSIDRERGVILRTGLVYEGSVYRIVEMTEVGFDEQFPPTTFEIRPVSSDGWITTA